MRGLSQDYKVQVLLLCTWHARVEWVAVTWPNKSAPRSADQAVKAGFITLYRAPRGLPLTLRTTLQIWLLILILKWETEAQRGRGSPHPWPRSQLEGG